MKVKIWESDIGFDFKLEAESMEDASMLTRLKLNHKVDSVKVHTYAYKDKPITSWFFIKSKKEYKDVI